MVSLVSMTILRLNLVSAYGRSVRTGGGGGAGRRQYLIQFLGTTSNFSLGDFYSQVDEHVFESSSVIYVIVEHSVNVLMR